MRLIFPVAALVGVIVLTGCSHTSSSHGKGPSAAHTYSLTFDQVREAAQDGDADAQYALGYMYYYGQNVTRNGNQAKFWIGRAASQHHKQAIRALAMMNEETQVVHRDNSISGVAQTSAGQNMSSRSGWEEVRRAEEKTPAQPVKSVVFSRPQTGSNSMAPSKFAANNQPQSFNKKDLKAEVHNKAFKGTKYSKNVHPHDAKTKIANAQDLQTHQPKQSHQVSKGSKSLSSDERSILSAPNNHYTLQLISSGSKGSVQQVISRNKLQNKAKVYHTHKNGKDFYVLIYGTFPTQEAANAAIARLPKGIKELKPWAKSYSSIKASIQSASSQNPSRKG